MDMIHEDEDFRVSSERREVRTTAASSIRGDW